MEPPNPDSTNIPDEEMLPYTKIHRSDSGSRIILGERKLPSPEDTIMSDANYTKQHHDNDTTMFDAYYADDGSSTGGTTIQRPPFELGPQAPAPQPRYVPAPRPHRGILDARYSAEDAAFFARANRQYQNKLQDIVRDNERKAREVAFKAAEKRKAILTAKASAAPQAASNAASHASKDAGFPDELWGDNRRRG